MTELGRIASTELDRGVNLVGPHRDDLELGMGALPVRGYASHGEGWSVALALRLGSYELLSRDVLPGGDPVLILDDVFAELDADRREQLARAANKAEQVIVTAAVADDVPDELRDAAGGWFELCGRDGATCADNDLSTGGRGKPAPGVDDESANPLQSAADTVEYGHSVADPLPSVTEAGAADDSAAAEPDLIRAAMARARGIARRTPRGREAARRIRRENLAGRNPSTRNSGGYSGPGPIRPATRS